jgi:hypothetical protein
MHPVVRKLFFTDWVIVKNSYGTPYETEGLFFNWFGRNVLFVAVAGWAGLMLAFAF